MKAQRQLFGRFVETLAPGRLEWIGLRPGRKQAMLEVTEVQALAELGLEGDHRCSKTPGSARQVTIISAEQISLIAKFCNLDAIDPALLRRNLVVSGININALRHQRFRIGEAVFEATAQCHPCSRMKEPLGPSGVANMLGYGGLCCKILQSGKVSIGDHLIPLPASD